MTLTATPPSPDVLDVDAGVIEEARQRQRRHRGMAAVAAVMVAGLVVIVLGSAGGGRTTQPTTANDSSSVTPTGKGVGFTSPRGRAEASFSMNEPAGVILVAQISVPHGARAFMNATTFGGAVRVTTWGAGPRQSLSCTTHGGIDVCTQLIEPCPFGAAVWRLHVVKLSGPAGLVRVKLGFGPSASQA
jgi:hypothetical protein